MQGLPNQDRDPATRLQEQLRATRLGRRWERMARLHAHEVEAVMAVHADVRRDIEEALRLLAEAGPITEDTTRAVERVFNDLARHASVPLQRDLTLVRDEVGLRSGRTLGELLVD
jgi:hypothetical protein